MISTQHIAPDASSSHNTQQQQHMAAAIQFTAPSSAQHAAHQRYGRQEAVDGPSRTQLCITHSPSDHHTTHQYTDKQQHQHTEQQQAQPHQAVHSTLSSSPPKTLTNKSSNTRSNTQQQQQHD
jgi:hypothetical protein